MERGYIHGSVPLYHTRIQIPIQRSIRPTFNAKYLIAFNAFRYIPTEHSGHLKTNSDVVLQG